MMDKDDIELIKHVLSADEGIRLYPYLDCCGDPWRKCDCVSKGKLTIGIGRNLDDVGITEVEAFLLLENSIISSIIDVERSFGSWFSTLTFPRKMVIICMSFNIGVSGLRAFQKMIKSLSSGDFSSAADHMLKSKWAEQVGKRAIRLAETMRTGTIQG